MKRFIFISSLLLLLALAANMMNWILFLGQTCPLTRGIGCIKWFIF